MNVRTSNPIIINGRSSGGQRPNGRKQRKSNADNMDDISNMDDVSCMDASSSSAQIKAFQQWFNAQRGGALMADGIWGPKTQTAWDSAGREFEQQIMGLMPDAIGSGTGTPASAAAPNPTTPKKKGKFFDKLKGAFNKAKDLGIVDSAKNTFQKKTKSGNASAPASTSPGSTSTGTPATPTATATVEQPLAPGQKKMSTGAKIGIGAGILVVIAAIWYATKGKKGK